MTQVLPITKARADLTSLVANASKKLNEYVITVNGIPSAVIVSAAEYDSWKETVDILSDQKLVKAIKAGEKDLKNGQYVTFDQLKKDLRLHV